MTWLAGGIGLIACGVVGVLRLAVLGTPGTITGLTLLADALWAAAVLTLAVGKDRESSVVARGALGVAACAAVALWPAFSTVMGLIAVPDGPEEAGAWRVWWYASAIVPVILGLIAAAMVARTRTVPLPWNWAPLCALGVQCVLWAVPQVIGTASPTTLLEAPGIASGFGTLGFLTSTLGLGILAVVLGNRSRAGTVPIFRSEPRA